MCRREFVQAAEVLGRSHADIALRVILPNVLSPVVSPSSLMVADAILTESALSFLGLGDAATLLAEPQHPYTQTLLASIPGGHWRA